MEFRLMAEDEAATVLFSTGYDHYENQNDGAEYEGDSKPVKVVTIREIIEAARKNGLSHIRGEWFDTNYDHDKGTWKIYGGCAVAQASYNLGIDPNTFVNAHPIITEIITLNDDEEKELDLDQIANEIIGRHTAQELDIKIYAREADYSNGLPEYIQDRLND